MFGCTTFGTIPEGGLLPPRIAKPSGEKRHKEVFVPIVNLGGNAFGQDGKILYVPGTNTGAEDMTPEE